jgi:hypothetical protein
VTDNPDERTVGSLDELTDLLTRWDGDRELYVRWTDDVHRDLRTEVSRDELTGIELPGLSVNSLRVEPWWGERPIRAWVARRLHDYRHLPETRGPDTQPWIVAGEETGRGPDNEPLARNCEPVALVAFQVIDEALGVVRELGDGWGSLRRD